MNINIVYIKTYHIQPHKTFNKLEKTKQMCHVIHSQRHLLAIIRNNSETMFRNEMKAGHLLKNEKNRLEAATA